MRAPWAPQGRAAMHRASTTSGIGDPFWLAACRLFRCRPRGGRCRYVAAAGWRQLCRVARRRCAKGTRARRSPPPCVVDAVTLRMFSGLCEGPSGLAGGVSVQGAGGSLARTARVYRRHAFFIRLRYVATKSRLKTSFNVAITTGALISCVLADAIIGTWARCGPGSLCGASGQAFSGVKKTLNKSLAFGFSNKQAFRFNILQERLSRPADWFSVSLIDR